MVHLKTKTLIVIFFFSIISCEDTRKEIIQGFISVNSQNRILYDEYCAYRVYKRASDYFILHENKYELYPFTKIDDEVYLKDDSLNAYDLNRDSIYKSIDIYEGLINLIDSSGAISIDFRCDSLIRYTKYEVVKDIYLIKFDSGSPNQMNDYVNRLKVIESNWYME